ncbi:MULTISPECIES: metallophosphoesterase family protein [Halomicrobium]|uniref:Phosphodiesterase, MJ0936 family n=2 Tax=Halomicrobium mukohataei TaxID=57705 RepID=C7NXR8_HALMD|nr:MULTISPECIES: metallophosphoesterase family protein [Halomicrobium]ACV46506.1 phosphodiesterase, MJ0936 family [Halomicrobium mukohataei DSM 12286]QCD65052.1 metallophosphoesterase family protein [Halomicrobium mukohataei]QFR19858.1 metallophosphoesterase [Halomicrobium sp. ZPS1]
MRIGLLSDVHGNRPALDAVLDDLPPVDELVCVGDVVGYNPWPAECLERVRETCSVVVQGNHDRTVETPERYAHNEMARAGLERARRALDDEQREWLADRPPRTTIDGGRYRLAHSHPDPDQLGTYVRPRQFPELRPYLDDHDGIVVGHTHVQHEATVDDRLIVNPGSVGQPRDGDPRAAYAVLDTDDDSVELRRVQYDIDRVISKVEALDRPRRLGIRLLDGS